MSEQIDKEKPQDQADPEVKVIPLEESPLLESPLVDDEELEAEKESESDESETQDGNEKRVDGLTKNELALKLLRAGVHTRDIVMKTKQVFGKGISHDLLGKMKKDMGNGLDPLRKKNSNEQDQQMIQKLNQLVSLQKAKKEEQQQAIKCLLKLFVAISEMLDSEDPESKKKLELNQEAFNSLIDTNLNLELIDKFQFLLKE